MYFPVTVKNCRAFDYTTKKGEPKVGYSVTVTTEGFESFSIFSNEAYVAGEPAVMLLTIGNFQKPYIYLEKIPKAA